MAEAKTEPNVEGPKTFTQEQVNELVGRARLEGREGALKQYGDPEALKADAEAGRKLKLAAMSEKEKLETSLATEQRARIDAESRVASAMIASEVRVLAMQKGIVDPDAALKLIDRNAVAYDEEKGVLGVGEALDALLAAKPYLKGHPQAPNLNAPPGKPAPAEPKLTDQQRFVAARLFAGLPPEQAYANYAKGLSKQS